ncbi:hypothetical protein [Nocardia iowensis]|uniref:Uncharacterized protein n=1 Tax=Nocardia iowensis TaxID=204891 RepID=A0ABX8RKZ8_NOCIO|nr:hypothetical protein [Nocardia iowensis]QXN90307.1 hypothetical protein KV110_33595 [Nocardia iowensis]
MNTAITATALVGKVRELVTANPDAITPTATNHPHGNRYVVRATDGRWRGSRLIGRALLELGADPDALAEHDAGALSAASTVMHFVRFGVWGQELLWLNIVQSEEGKGHPWQWALTFADLRIKGVTGSPR